jgi:hypothetical protein
MYIYHIPRLIGKKRIKMLIGREQEKDILLRALNTPESELVAVIGRRRVGKTYLIRSVYGDKIRFETSGVQGASIKEQVNNFYFQLKNTFDTAHIEKPPKTWQEAFFALTTCLEQMPSVYQNVLFFDELPWLAARKSGFLNAFSFFWNMWAVKKNIVVVICGSAASWMIEKVVNDRGGLHNRITRRIDLQPFTLGETEMFFKNKNIQLGRYQTLQLYMVMGGIPHYLNEVVGSKSAIQNIEDLCFSHAGMLKKEFLRLYPALFENAENHIAIIQALSQKQSGMTRLNIIETTGLPDGGGTSVYLDELESSGFITSYPGFQKKRKELIYRLTDEYSLFYLNFIENHSVQDKETWQQVSQTQAFKSWCGYAFESICLKHITQIRKALGISGIYSEAATFYYKGHEGHKGVQIDLVLNRNDNTINLFEIKFYKEVFGVTKSMAEDLVTKRELFQLYTQTKKHIFISLISPYGITENDNSKGLIDHSITLDALYAIV